VHKKNFILFFKIVVTIGILVFIFSKIPITDVWLSLKHTIMLYVGISFLILIGMRYVMAYRIKILTNVHKMKISLHQFVKISLLSSFYGFFLPGTLAGGAVRWYKISKADNKPAESLAAIVYDRFISSLGLIMIGTIFLFLERHAYINQEMGFILFASLIALIIGYVIAFNGNVAIFLIKMNDSIVFIPEVVRGKIKKVIGSTIDYRNISERKHVEIFIVSIAYDLFGILSMYLFSLSLDLPLTFFQIGWIRSIVLILSMLPVSFSGIGVREGSMIFLLQSYGIEPSGAIALSFLILSGNIVLALCGGIIELKNLFSPHQGTGRKQK